jgi:hypothetical protein
VIVNGSFTGQGGGRSAGIGTAYVDGGTSSLRTLIIENGNVTGISTTSDIGAAGIGTGYAYNSGTSGIGNLIIENGKCEWEQHVYKRQLWWIRYWDRDCSIQRGVGHRKPDDP